MSPRQPAVTDVANYVEKLYAEPSQIQDIKARSSQRLLAFTQGEFSELFNLLARRRFTDPLATYILARRILQLIREVAPRTTVGQAHFQLAMCSLSFEQSEEAIVHFAEALRFAPQAHSPLWEVGYHLGVARAYLPPRQLTKSLEHCHKGLIIARRLDNIAQIAAFNQVKGHVALLQEDYPFAEMLLDQAHQSQLSLGQINEAAWQ